MKKIIHSITWMAPLLLVFSSFGQNFVDVSKSYNGQTVTLSTDQVLEVKLPRTPSNGYIWCESSTATEKLSQTVKTIGDYDFISDPHAVTSSGKRMVGQSGTQILRYVGSSSGTTLLKFELKRPWVKDVPALETFTITVNSGGNYTGNYTPPVKAKFTHVTSTPKSVPSHWDWRSQCTPIENQAQCGSCWAFAGVGTLECNIKIIDGVTRDISEQFIINCDAQDGDGCQGGNCPHHMWLSPQGAVYNADLPYADASCNVSNQTADCVGTCGTYTFHETIDSYADVLGEDTNGVPPDANMKEAIYNYGPIWIALDASSSAWNNYSGGLLTETGSANNIDHAVILVGWVDSSTVAGGGYWILRNSWGTGWGINGTGYMYITYGSDLVGCDADYIVYKGGINHSVPPVANFAAMATSSCTGIIQFKDSSTNAPTQWLWDFGDGTTSILQNPSHTYTTSGTFNVTLTAYNSFGNNSKIRSSYINVNLAAAPTTTGASCTGPCSVTLNASGSGTLNWYSAEIGGNLLGTGTSFNTPVLNQTTTYYVQEAIQQSPQAAGMTAKTTSGSYYTSSSDWALTFDALSSITINSVTVYANSTASRCIWLKNSSGIILDSVTTSIPTGTQTVTLNFSVPAGSGYELGTDGGCNLWRESSGASYPYTTAGLVSITGNTASALDHYYYFYNWQVQPQSCLSAMAPVTATINSTSGISESSSSDFGIFPNPNNGKFEITLNNQNYQEATITMVNILGETVLEKKISYNKDPLLIDASELKQGLYYIKVQTDNFTYLKKVVIGQ